VRRPGSAAPAHAKPSPASGGPANTKNTKASGSARPATAPARGTGGNQMERNP
jgi:hypothetical protein